MAGYLVAARRAGLWFSLVGASVCEKGRKGCKGEVLLINPWIYDFAAHNLWIEPLGLLMIASALQDSGYAVTVLDCLAPHPGAPAARGDGSGKFLKTALDKPEAVASVPRRFGRYGWPLGLLPFETMDLVAVVAANLFNLLMTAIFLTRPKGWKRFERVAGLAMVGMAVPLGAAVILNLLAKRGWWFVVLPLPLILHCIVELLLDYILKLDFRKTRLLGPYLALFYLGQMGLIGYAFIVEPAYGFATLATYFLVIRPSQWASETTR